MANGRITRSNQRHAAARRRLARYGDSRRGKHHRKLPPNLLRHSSGRDGNGRKAMTWVPKVAIAMGALGLLVSLAFIVITVITSVLGIAGTVRAYEDVNSELPNAAEIAVETFQTTRIYDRDGKLLQEVDNPDYGWRTFVPLEQISPHLIDATVAAEDATFWTNPGIEPTGIVRAAFINVSGTGSSGASTITQQLVRSIYPEKIGFEVTYTRKFREALAAVALSEKYSKTDILTMYLNQIYYGARSYGVQAASQTFFHKNAADLTLAEASLLAGLPQAPSFYDPSIPDNFPYAKARQQYVLDQMVKYRYITQAEATAAWNEPLDIHGSRTGAVHNAPHFTQYVREYIIEEFGEDALYGGLEITTSIDLELQQQAEEVVAQGVAEMQQYQRNNGAAVVMVPWSGEVLAMVGSADFNNSLIAGQVNYATSLIQPGSSIKPLVYAAAFEQGWHPGSVILDVPTTWDSPGQPEPYEPQNYTRQFYGAITAREALGNSLNIPAVKATEYAGVSGVMDVTRRMGYDDSLPLDSSFYGLSLGLGAGEVQLLEHTNAFATLANNGGHVPVNPIRKITDSQGNVLFELDEEQINDQREQALPAGNAYQVTSILTDPEARERIFTNDNLFTNTQEELGRPVAAKSGTTENWRDLWTMGYTTDVSIGVWVGRGGDTNTDDILSELDGIQAAGPIWQDLMRLVHNDPEFATLLDGPDGLPIPEEFAVPDDVREMEVCATTGNRATAGASTEDLLVRGQEPQNACGDLTEYQQEQLDEAMEAVRDGDANWAGGAVSSIRQYNAMATGRPVETTSNDDEDDEGSGESEESGDSGGSDGTFIEAEDPEQVIEPID